MDIAVSAFTFRWAQRSQRLRKADSKSVAELMADRHRRLYQRVRTAVQWCQIRRWPLIQEPLHLCSVRIDSDAILERGEPARVQWFAELKLRQCANAATRWELRCHTPGPD